MTLADLSSFRSSDAARMDPMRAIAEEKGVFLTQEALAFGYDDKAITRAVRARWWHRVRRGAYVPFDIWEQADEVGRHLIRVSAVHRSYGDIVAFSHTTACLLLGINVWGADLDRVHVTRRDGSVGRVERDVVHHEGYAEMEREVERVDGRLVLPPARAALQMGLNHSTETALVALDSVLFQGLAGSSDIGNLFDSMQHWPYSRRLQIAVRMADPGGQTVGESRSRWMFRCGGVPLPLLQFEVYDEHGQLIGTTDFAWPGRRLLGEFDGKVKYGRLLRPGLEPGDVVFAEKQREDALRHASQSAMTRVVWGDLDRPRTTCARVKGLLDRAA